LGFFSTGTRLFHLSGSDSDSELDSDEDQQFIWTFNQLEFIREYNKSYKRELAIEILKQTTQKNAKIKHK